MDQEKLLNTILVEVVSMKEEMREKMVTKQEFDQKTNEIMTHIDGFVKLHQTLDIELVAMREKYNRLETRLVRLEQKFGMAT